MIYSTWCTPGYIKNNYFEFRHHNKENCWDGMIVRTIYIAPICVREATTVSRQDPRHIHLIFKTRQSSTLYEYAYMYVGIHLDPSHHHYNTVPIHLLLLLCILVCVIDGVGSNNEIDIIFRVQFQDAVRV